jgi:glycosyltransferase involved in cell wall biosynthesis
LDVFVLSSHGEAFPNALIEAMACDLPCIASDVGDCRDILGGKGIIFTPGNVEELVTAIEKCLSNPLKGTRQRVLKNYAISSMILAYKNLYTKG